MREYRKRPEVKAKRCKYAKEYRDRPEVKERNRKSALKYSRCPKNIERIHKRNQHPEIKAKKATYDYGYRQRPNVKASDKEYKYWSDIKRKYNITKDEYLAMLETQKRYCALCGKLLGDDIVIDHDHETGGFRGLLHRKCNLGLGHFDDSIDKLQLAIQYLRRSK